MRTTPAPSTVARVAASLLALALGACGGDDPPDAGAPPSDDVPLTFGEDSEAADATVPTDCSSVATDALAEAWGAAPILDAEDSYYEEVIEELRCEFWIDAQATDELSVQLSVASHYSGYNTAVMGTSSGEYTEVDGFDEARLYDSGIIVAKRNGFVVVVDGAEDTLTDEQRVAVALDVTG